MTYTKFKKSIFRTPIKSKARAKIISIQSPAKFRESIRTLKKGNYTLADERALILAQNRARAQLYRTTLSDKERKEMREISKIRIPHIKNYSTRFKTREEYDRYLSYYGYD